MKNLKKNGTIAFKQSRVAFKGIIYCLFFCSMLFSGCSSSSTKCDELLGRWKGEEFKADVRKNGDQYVLSMKGSTVDGSYPATCENGKLKVNLPLFGAVELTKDAFYILGERMIRTGDVNSNQLSKSKAESLIVEAHNFHNNEFIEIQTEYPSVNPMPQDLLDDLQSKGLITLHDSTKFGLIEASTGLPPRSKVVELTDEGKKYLLPEASNKLGYPQGEYKLKTCDISFGDIIDIQIQEKGEENVTIVNYTIKRKNITPLGNNLSEGTENRSATFSLVNNVWKIWE